jgi:tetratricopeptide (TPR) repeat protein
MPDPRRIQSLVEEILETERSVEDVCREHPELLDDVRARLREVSDVEAQLDELFPASRQEPAAQRSFAAASPPQIDGYTIQRVLGHGGMGVVYAADHLRLGRQVAIKMLLSGGHASPNEVTRLLREASTVARLRHPHVVQVYDVGEFQGRPYFTMELMEGGHLGRVLAGTPLPHREAAQLLVTLAGAVQAAHDAGIVHRDLKPANILFDLVGTPKITDFGIARIVGEASNLTQTGTPMGTPSYMAPEQALGKSHAIGPAVDIYSLGAILYEVLTGRPPFRAETALETERQVVSEEPVPPARLNPKVPRDLETICLKCLHKDAERRYPSAAALADDIGRFQRGEPVTARPAGAFERLARRVRRNRTGAALLVTAVALLVLAILAGAREWSHVVRDRAERASWGERQQYVRRLQAEGRITEARAILGRLSVFGSPELREELRRARAELDVVEQLEAVRLARGRADRTVRYDPEADAAYALIFERADIGTLDQPPEQVAARIVSSELRASLVAALDDWAHCVSERPRLARLLAIARHADPDPWRDRARDPRIWEDPEALAALARDVSPGEQPVELLLVVAGLLEAVGGDAEQFLRRVQFAHPHDYWVNFALAEELGTGESAIGFYRAALAARPHAVAIWVNLGILLVASDLEAALAHWNRAIELDPESPVARLNIAIALFNRGRFAEAVEMADSALVRTALDDPAHAITTTLRATAAECLEAAEVGPADGSLRPR